MRYFLLAWICTMTCEAALPPAWEGVRELRAILEDKQLSQYLNSGDVIESLHHEGNMWIIQTNHSQIEVEVIHEPRSQPGPGTITLHFQKLE